MYVLDDDNHAVEVSDPIEWMRWRLENWHRHHVGDDYLGGPDGPIRVSTVFLGVDHNFFGGPPLLFETMVFGGKHDLVDARYTTWALADTGHKATVAIMSADIRPTRG